MSIIHPIDGLLETVLTDDEGFYAFPYKHTGKATTYGIILEENESLGIPEAITKYATIKANKFAVVDFVVDDTTELLMVDKPSDVPQEATVQAEEQSPSLLPGEQLGSSTSNQDLLLKVPAEAIPTYGIGYISRIGAWYAVSARSLRPY